LLEAGAITLEQGVDGHHYIRASVKREGRTISRAVEKLAFNEQERPKKDGLEWFVSAPGKVILFGEHAVVHGVTALAASVDLRCYGLTGSRYDSKVSVNFVDLGNFYQEWDIASLPWDAASYVPPGTDHPDELDTKLLDAISARALSPSSSHDNPTGRNAALTFLYLYMTICPKPGTSSHGGPPAIHFSARGALPVGAGLGSSASFSSCAASAILLVTKRIAVPPLPAPSRPPRAEGEEDPGHVHVSHAGRRAIPQSTAGEVNKWAFVAEKVLHGNPSGVDNSVAVFGGALAYTRPGFTRKSGMEPIQGFKSLRFLLINTKVPRNTKALVAGVGLKKQNEPELVTGILDSIQDISDEARRILADPELSRERQIEGIGKLITENHAFLRELGVSHPSLEAVKTKTASYNLQTKLTGAGGGGCAVTLIPDDFADENLKELIADLYKDGFEAYVTSVGGSGLGILSPYDPALHRGFAPATPPETPDDGHEDVEGTEDDTSSEPLRSPFERMSSDEFIHWAEGRGRWLFV